MKTFQEFINEKKEKTIYRVIVYTQGKAGFYDHAKHDLTKTFTDVEKARKYAKSWSNSGTSPLISSQSPNSDVWSNVKFSK